MADGRFTLSTYPDREAGALGLLTFDNGADHRKPTVLDTAALVSLHTALDELERSECRGLLVTGKPFVFAAGADLKAFTGADAAFARSASRAGHEAFSRLRGLPIPTLAAINGVCLGGGMELALHCDARSVSTAARALGFPEVFLSIFPAWGGTQLVPRLIGAERALQVIVGNALDHNRTLSPQQAVELGLADRLVDAVDFLPASLALLARLVSGEERIERSEWQVDDLDGLMQGWGEHVDERVHGATPAPYTAIELIGFAASGGDLAAGREREIDALAELLPSRQAQAAVYAFNLTQRRVKRQPGRPEAPPRTIRKAAVVGAGRMGAQLGALLLERLEVPLVMKDVDAGVLDRARQTVEGTLAKRVEKGRLREGKARFLTSNVTYTLEYEPVAGSDFVLEAALEELALKREIFAEVEAVVDEECVLATNTSALSVSAASEQLAHPERVVGVHFFNPVAVLPLIELVRAERTDAATYATAFELASQLGKSAVACADTPGFVVNRVLTRFLNACGEAATRGAEFAEIDEAIKQLGLPMGPFELLGLVGLDVAAHVGETLHAAFGERFAEPVSVRALAEAGLDGVYHWPEGRKQVKPEAATLWETDADADPPCAETIRRQMLEVVADEVGRMLDDGTVADARDLDTAMLLGAGWPFFMGGICPYLDQTGVSERVLGRRLIGADAAA